MVRDNERRETVGWSIFFSLAILAMLFPIGWTLYHNHQHTEFLRAHGCQLITATPTGRWFMHGKAGYQPEYVYVYECADGMRTEVY